jgi:hypothetical protein
MLRKVKWQIPAEPLVARYNWRQGPVLGRGPAVEKHWYRLYSWFQTFALFWILYACFWLILRRLNYVSVFSALIEICYQVLVMFRCTLSRSEVKLVRRYIVLAARQWMWWWNCKKRGIMWSVQRRRKVGEVRSRFSWRGVSQIVWTCLAVSCKTRSDAGGLPRRKHII